MRTPDSEMSCSATRTWQVNKTTSGEERERLALVSSLPHNAPHREEHQVDQEQKPRERTFIGELLAPDWRPTRVQVLWTIRVAIVIVVLLGFLTLIGLPFGITLWAWLKLLI